MGQQAAGWNRLFFRKPVETLRLEAESHGMKRCLNGWNLLFLGIGCILGAGIYVMPGTAAANFAGPGVMLSFLLAGLACALTALCYAELSSTLPVSGSAYTYCYAAMGEVFAWGLGWLMLLEYGLAASTLAVGFSGYLTSLAGSFGVAIPAVISTPFIQAGQSPDGIDFVVSGGFNLIAALAIFAVTAILVIGVSESARANNILVVVKIAVLLIFIVLGVGAVTPENWTPLIPPNEGGFTYGWQGVARGASILFFAYLGFETVSTAASETRDPQRDLPFGILGSLAVCTLIYIIVAAVLTGIVPYRELGVPDPIALASDRMGYPAFAILIKVGALMGLASVLLVNAFGQSRVAFAMSVDGLLPRAMRVVHGRFRTPYLGIIILGVISAVGAAFLPLSLLGDLVSLGVGLAFSIVALCLMWLRTTQPELERPFKVPLGGFRIGGVWIGYVPVAAILMSWAMILPVALDIIDQAARGHLAPAIILGCYGLLGVFIYLGYGMRRSRVGQGDLQPVPEAPAGS